MKKTLLTIFSAFAFSAAFAQSGLQLQNAPTTVYGSYSQSNPLQATFPVVNTGSQPLTIKVARKMIAEVSGSENNFCWGVDCYPPFVSVSPNPETIAAGTTNQSFIADYTPLNNPGITTIRYSFFKDSGSPDSVHVTIHFDATSAISGVKQGLNAAVTLSSPMPNPANELTAIPYSIPAGSRGKLRIFNTIGGLIKEVNITQRQGTAIVNTSNLPDGVYFYSLLVDNRAVATKKLVVKH
ncbi:T9SS type A sorting domain-containing protein [Adhaeribacter soli]|uniref:T9SS type A sorting domain-containing protein n=1 Tax=Adhaeribacter soli TaxID=2607655 RepID=A0A5N1IWQ0_9BACT|nr:T9SS type A sorting domain-containing protein [Adhaeribacter soli]KAA9333576.1 T9SS type A sorting domain-containing protein [Adhaeribacter soli]